VDEWKILFGVFAKYPNVAEFKRRVLQPAINQVNEQGEFKLTLEQEKLGRAITHFNIVIEEQLVTENPAQSTEFFAKASNVNLFESLSETERQTVKATADKYIAKNQIDDETYKRNIYKKAVSERWGLLEIDTQQQQYQKQAEEIKKKLEADRLAELEKQQEVLRKEQENNQFVQLFESLEIGSQKEILDKVRNLIATEIPMFLKMFDKENDKKSAHTDIRFRGYFKRVMAIE
jgi:plasmid replication initiation protein